MSRLLDIAERLVHKNWLKEGVVKTLLHTIASNHAHIEKALRDNIADSSYNEIGDGDGVFPAETRLSLEDMINKLSQSQRLAYDKITRKITRSDDRIGQDENQVLAIITGNAGTGKSAADISKLLQNS